VHEYYHICWFVVIQQLLSSLYFRDGKRRIDFVLVRSDEDEDNYSETFERNLEKEGLELEHEVAVVCNTNPHILLFCSKIVTFL